MAEQTIVAYFDSRSEAETAQAELGREGIDAGSIKLLPEEGSTYTRSTSETAYDHHRDEGGFWASLGNLFLPEDDRYAYAEGMSRGGVTLSVTIDEARYARAAQILEDSGAVNIDELETEWKSAGWSGYTAADAGVAGTASPVSAETDVDDGVVEVVEEQLRVGKRVTEGGRVRIRTYVVETPVETEVELRSERVIIERRPVDREATADDLKVGDRTLEAVERREEAVVSKEARVVEEIGLRTEDERRTETVSDTVRKTEVEVVDERTGETRPGGIERDPGRR